MFETDEKKERIKQLIAEGRIKEAFDLAGITEADFLFFMGNYASEEENHEMAENLFSQVLEIEPDNAAAWYNKGRALACLDRFDEAVSCYDEALKRDPEDSDAWLNKGIALQNIGKHTEALSCFRIVLKATPEDGEAWYCKGVSLSLL